MVLLCGVTCSARSGNGSGDTVDGDVRGKDGMVPHTAGPSNRMLLLLCACAVHGLRHHKAPNMLHSSSKLGACSVS